jgi:hypothetical protein
VVYRVAALIAEKAKAERATALSAEKVAIEQAANLTGQLVQVLKELKAFQDKAKPTEIKQQLETVK